MKKIKILIQTVLLTKLLALSVLAQDPEKNGTEHLLPELPIPTKKEVLEPTALALRQLTTLSDFSTTLGITIVAEKKILETPIVPPATDKINFLEYLVAVTKVHGWTLERTGDKTMFVIKANDLSKTTLIPISSLSAENYKKFQSNGYEQFVFNNVIYVRVPHGLLVPTINKPIPLQYTVVINKYDQRQLKDIGLSIDSLTLLQNRYFTVFSQLSPARSLYSLERGTTGLGLGVDFKYDKFSQTVLNSFVLNLEGTNTSATVWSEEQTKNLLIENRNVNDSRVAVDREEISAGRRFSIEPLGGNIFRVELQDTTISDDNEVSGLLYKADISLDGRLATLVLNKVEKNKSKRLFGGNRISNRSVYYIVTIRVNHARASKFSKRHQLKNNLIWKKKK